MLAVIRNDVIASDYVLIHQRIRCPLHDHTRFVFLRGRRVADPRQRLCPATELGQRGSFQVVRELYDLVVSEVNTDVATQNRITVHRHSVAGLEFTETKPKRDMSRMI